MYMDHNLYRLAILKTSNLQHSKLVWVLARNLFFFRFIQFVTNIVRRALKLISETNFLTAFVRKLFKSHARSTLHVLDKAMQF